jgi:ABC-type lipoprotein export system ATPase subunit
MSTLLTPTKGDVYFTTNIHNNSIDNFRNQHIGFIFQFHYLIAHLTILENIQMVTKKSKKEIIDVLNRLKISKLAKKYPSDISGGERQRVAIARAIINDPQYIFADEPTGNLDSKNSKIIFDILRNIDATVLVVTHNSSFIKSNDRVIEIKDGVIL